MKLERSSWLYQLLERPRVYNAVQALFRIGGNQQSKNLFAELIDSKSYDSVLELGCGTGHWSVTHCRNYIRTDINDSYFPPPAESDAVYRKADATDLSEFRDDSFELVYSMGLYHHLPEEAVIASLQESARVLHPGGRIVVGDAILPKVWRRPLAWLVRKLDRGQWVRYQDHTTALLEKSGLRIQRQSRYQWGIFRLEGCFWEATPD
jgi:ubiquinone/menaquinone biosynthesis C-methylase UbiE